MIVRLQYCTTKSPLNAIVNKRGHYCTCCMDCANPLVEHTRLKIHSAHPNLQARRRSMCHRQRLYMCSHHRR